MKNAQHIIPLLKKVSATDIFFIALADEQDVGSRNRTILHQLKLNYEVKLTARDVRNIVAGTIIAYPEASGAFIGQLAHLFREQWGSIEREMAVAHGGLTGTMKALAILKPRSQDQMLVQSIELWKEVLTRHANWAELSDELSGELSNDFGKYLGGFADHGKVFKPLLSFLRESYKHLPPEGPFIHQVADKFIFGLFSEFSTITQLELLQKALG